MMRRLLTFLRQERGVALIEFAFVAPVLILLLVGAVELTRYISIAQKLDKAAYAMADLTNQYPPATKDLNDGEINEPQLNGNVLPNFRRLMQPYMQSDGDGSVILSSIRKEGTDVMVKWRKTSLGFGGNLNDNDTRSAINDAQISTITVPSQPLKATSGLIAPFLPAMYDGENMIVAEVFYHYQPILQPMLSEMGVTVAENTLVRRVYSRPRLGDLACLPPNYIYPDCQAAGGGGGGGGGSGDKPCRDECGEQRASGEMWCRAGGNPPIVPTMKCVNGVIYNLGGMSGVGCDALGKAPQCK